MKTEYKNLTTAVFLSALLIYLLGSFASADFNIQHWSELARWVIACIMLCVIVIIIGATINP